MSGCASSTAGPSATEKPATVEAVPGTDAKKVVLTEQAVTRLGVKIDTVATTAVIGADRPTTSVPYSALIYDVNGITWIFEEVEPRSFLRKRVDVQIVNGETVIMTNGPPVGSRIVIVGAAVLYGTELGTGS